MLSEIKVALRGLLKTPGFTIIAIVTIALAIGANTAVLSLVNALLVRPLPYKNPQQLVLIWEQFANQGLDSIPVSAPEYLDYEKQLTSYDGIAAFDYVDLNLTGSDVPERVQGAVVSPSLFPVLGIQPLRGRTFAQEEQGEGHDDVVVISARLWQRRFNSDPAVLNSKMMLNGRGYTVVGVMPATFEFPLPLFNKQGGTFAERADIWKPIAFTEDELKSRGSRSYGVIGRLRKGVAANQAQAELNTIIANWIPRFKENYAVETGFGARVYGLQEQVVGGMRPALLILLGAVALVLLIACANLTTMLLARGGSREREMAIRVALGAGPLRLLRFLLIESVVLSVIGGCIGIVTAIWGLDVLTAVGAKTVPRLREVNLDATVLSLTFIISVATGVLFGIVPALASAKPELTEALKEGGRSSTTGARRNQLRNTLVISEIALALVLLIGAGLLVKSFVQIQNVNPGFNPKNVVTGELSLPLLKYARGKPVIDFYAEAVRRVSTLPGIEAAALTNVLPLSGSNTDNSFHIEGRDSMVTKVFPDEEARAITPDYFRVLQTPLLRGRFFTDADNVDAPGVVIINRAMAKKYWPDEDAIGKRINFGDADPTKIKWFTIVGIVADIHHQGLDVDPKPEFYLPHAQRAYRQMVLTVRSKQDARVLMPALRKEVQAIDPDQPLANVRTLEAVAAESIAPRRMSVTLLGAFAGIALLLAAVGIYGVIAYLVVQRTHEIGVRMALGAQRRDVLQMVVGHALKLVGVGAIIGLVLAFLSTRALAVLLYGVSTFDLLTFIFVTLTLAAVALLASYIPALRATRADPMIALSHNA
jgi:putative ABC transport system permease protein